MKNAIIAIACAVLLGSAAANAQAEVTNGQAAPDFELKDSTGKTHKLADYKGKTVVLEWTNSECPYVVRHYEANTMIDLAKQNPDVIWLAIDSSKHHEAAGVQTWIEKEGIPYPVLMDTDGKVGQLYGAKTTPRMFVITPDGNIAYQGAIDNNQRGKKKNPTNYVAQALDEIKKGAAIKTASTKPYGCSVKY